MTADEFATEAAAVQAIALAAAEGEPLDPGALIHYIVPAGATSTVLDLERFALTPRRRRGTVTVWDATSFATYVNVQRGNGTTVYTDVRRSTVTAVINGHEAAVSDPGWGDHRALLQMRTTPQWDAWTAFCGRMQPQVDFAEFLEDHLVDIYEPSSADMLELAQTFEANTGVEFASSSILDSGQRQLTYKETIAAKAGQSGQIVVPKEVLLGLQPYEGSETYRCKARFRFRISNGTLTLGLILDDPAKVLETAFADILADVRVELDPAITVLAGTAAGPVG